MLSSISPLANLSVNYNPCFPFLFFFKLPAPTEIYTLSLHDALPIFLSNTFGPSPPPQWPIPGSRNSRMRFDVWEDRKSTRLNSSHRCISYAVFCLKKKKKCVEAEILVSNIRQTTDVCAYRLT